MQLEVGSRSQKRVTTNRKVVYAWQKTNEKHLLNELIEWAMCVVDQTHSEAGYLSTAALLLLKVVI